MIEFMSGNIRLLIFLVIIIQSLPFGTNLSCVHVALVTVRNQLHHNFNYIVVIDYNVVIDYT